MWNSTSHYSAKYRTAALLCQMFYDNQCVLKYASCGNLSAEVRAWIDVMVACSACQILTDSLGQDFARSTKDVIYSHVYNALFLSHQAGNCFKLVILVTQTYSWFSEQLYSDGVTVLKILADYSLNHSTFFKWKLFGWWLMIKLILKY